MFWYEKLSSNIESLWQNIKYKTQNLFAKLNTTQQVCNQGVSQVLWAAVYRYLPNRSSSLNFQIVSKWHFWKLKKCLSWRRSDYLLGIFDIRIPFCETKSIIFFLHAFLRKQRHRRHHEWCSRLYLKFVKKRTILSIFFPSKTSWERDYNLPSWAQH